jgi:Transglycosylase SLT domain
VCAVVEQESSWDCHAIRYEPAFRIKYVEGQKFSPTEEIARSISWGLMQVMGQVAREQGFKGPSLAVLCDPATGLEMGCTVLRSKLSAAGDNVLKGLLLWNGGGDPNYGDKVLERLSIYSQIER